MPVTATPEAFASFEETRSFPKSKSERLFEGAPETAAAQVDEFNKLFGKWFILELSSIVNVVVDERQL